MKHFLTLTLFCALSTQAAQTVIGDLQAGTTASKGIQVVSGGIRWTNYNGAWGLIGTNSHLWLHDQYGSELRWYTNKFMVTDTNGHSFIISNGNMTLSGAESVASISDTGGLVASNITANGTIAGNGAGVTNVPASGLTGTLALGNFPTSVITNGGTQTITNSGGLRVGTGLIVSATGDITTASAGSFSSSSIHVTLGWNGANYIDVARTVGYNSNSGIFMDGGYVYNATSNALHVTIRGGSPITGGAQPGANVYLTGGTNNAGGTNGVVILGYDPIRSFSTSVIITNGLASYATNVFTVSATGWTNTSSAAAQVGITAATSLALYNRLGTNVWSPGTVSTPMVFVIQPGQWFTGTGITGSAWAW